MTNRVLAILALVCLVTVLAAAQDVPRKERVTVFSSPDVKAAVSKERVISCFQQLAHEWQLNEQDLPNVVVFNASRTDAESAFVLDKVSVRENGFDQGQSKYFEIWLIDEPSIPKAVFALENVIETRFGLKVSDSDREAVIARVTRSQMAVVDRREVAIQARTSH